MILRTRSIVSIPRVFSGCHSLRLAAVKGVNTLYSTIVRLPAWKYTEALVISGFPLDNTANLPRRMYQNRILSGVPGSDGKHIPPLLINPHGGPGDTEISAWNAGDSLSW